VGKGCSNLRAKGRRILLHPPPRLESRDAGSGEGKGGGGAYLGRGGIFHLWKGESSEGKVEKGKEVV